jgi:membrane-bound metal-dependent hydrolase YbcI (DUF457 family)
MPSPFGHALAGVLTAWTADLIPGQRTWRWSGSSWLARAGDGLTLTCAALAAVPDLDLLVARHRTMTHSVAAVAVVGMAAALAARRSEYLARIASMCAASYASHLLLDWMAVDQTVPRGLQLLWPFTTRWYISDWNVFSPTERQQLFAPHVMRLNAIAIAQEIGILSPFLLIVWLVRMKAFARLAAQVSRGHEAPQ